MDRTGGNATLREQVPGITMMCHELDRPMVEDLGLMVSPRYDEFVADHDIAFSVDLDGVWYGCQEVLPFMLARQRGSIVNIASGHAFQTFRRTFPYLVAKHGVLGLTRALAVVDGPRGVRVNAIYPGYIATRVNLDTGIDCQIRWQRSGGSSPFSRSIGSVRRTRSPGRPRSWLPTEASFITGASVVIDSGTSPVLNRHGH